MMMTKEIVRSISCDLYCHINELCYFYLFQDKLLTKLEENEPELASSQEDEVISYRKNLARFHINLHCFS